MMKKNLLTDTTFKESYSNHNSDFKHEKYENSTELGKFIWQLKCDQISFSAKWKIITKVYGSPNPLFHCLYPQSTVDH